MAGGGGGLSSNFVHQMCHKWGESSSNSIHQMCHQGGRGVKIVFFSECGGKFKNEKRGEIFTLAVGGVSHDALQHTYISRFSLSAPLLATGEQTDNI